MRDLRKNSVTQAVAEAKAILGDRLSTSQAVREQHGKDQTWAPGAPPDAVAFVKSTAEVQRIVAAGLVIAYRILANLVSLGAKP